MQQPATRRRLRAVRAACATAARDKLDSPRWRWLLGAIGSVGVTVRHRQPCFVYWRQGAWIHRFHDTTIPHPTCAEPAPYEQFTAEAQDTFLHEYTPREGDVVFDVGAGVGTATILFSRLVGPTGRVIALEAHPATYGWLDRLCHLNALTNVIPIQVAAAERAGELAITDLDEHVSNTVLADGSGVKVPARALDDIAEALGIDRVDLVKMNIEGAEQIAIKGMGNLIRRTRHVCISCHDFLADDGGPESMRTKSVVHDFLVANGFELTTRGDAPDPWTRDYLYGTNPRMDGPATS